MSLAEKEKAKKIKKAAPSAETMNRLLKTIARRLDDASVVAAHNETRLEQAYEAILQCSKAALLASGYRVRAMQGHHYESIDTLRFTLAVDEERAEYFQALRKLRHEGLYEGLIPVYDDELAVAIEEAQMLFEQLKTWLSEFHSEFLG